MGNDHSHKTNDIIEFYQLTKSSSKDLVEHFQSADCRLGQPDCCNAAGTCPDGSPQTTHS